ncbi:MAG: orotidine-5'-phosphate decarboxylase [Kiritimatiellaceae bacterium]|nr:MAG: orotidine-5'-phosphate decarboxylase [Kiritimatiellaceae bacterium]|tara:strand:+ start:1103 stop:1804 length:702 start_codon:yes stop_codon:yes gene_type:complete
MNGTEIIVALDVPDGAAMREKLQAMSDDIGWYKVGLELFCSEGPSVLDPLKELNKSIFLDLKLHDIPRTVGNAVKTAAAHGVNLMTVHAVGGRAMLEEAARAAASCEHPPKLVAVTTLTSLNEDDFEDLGIERSVEEQAVALGRLAMESGIDGLVTSAHEARALREAFPDALLVTPGIRMPSGDVGDQKRVATPSFAAEQGATHLVIGRPIVQAEDPVAAAAILLDDLKKAVV